VQGLLERAQALGVKLVFGRIGAATDMMVAEFANIAAGLNRGSHEEGVMLQRPSPSFF
jgi:hypothetical protein